MELRIQYARATDGVSLAYTTLGRGPPLVHVAFIPFTHLQIAWELPHLRRWYERLSARHQFIQYDGRGSGLSSRDVADFSLDRVQADADERDVTVSGPAIALATSGELVIVGASSGTSLTLRPGQAAFVTPDERTVRVSGNGELFLAAPGEVRVG